MAAARRRLFLLSVRQTKCKSSTPRAKKSDSRKAKKHNQMTPVALFVYISAKESKAMQYISSGSQSGRGSRASQEMRPLSGLWGALLGLHAAAALVSPLCNPQAKGNEPNLFAHKGHASLFAIILNSNF